MSNINLNERRAEKEQNNSLWTPEDCAEAFLREIKSGEINPSRLCILYWQENEGEDGWSIHRFLSQCNRSEELDVLELEKRSLIDGWMRR